MAKGWAKSCDVSAYLRRVRPFIPEFVAATVVTQTRQQRRALERQAAKGVLAVVTDSGTKAELEELVEAGACTLRRIPRSALSVQALAAEVWHDVTEGRGVVLMDGKALPTKGGKKSP